MLNTVARNQAVAIKEGDRSQGGTEEEVKRVQGRMVGNTFLQGKVGRISGTGKKGSLSNMDIRIMRCC